MFKKRTRPQNQTTRERSILQDDAEAEERPPNDDLAEDGDEKLPCVAYTFHPAYSFVLISIHRLSDLLELRKLRKSRQGIDSVRLTKGDTKKKKRKRPDDLGQMDIGGLKQGVVPTTEEEEYACSLQALFTNILTSTIGMKRRQRKPDARYGSITLRNRLTRWT